MGKKISLVVEGAIQSAMPRIPITNNWTRSSGQPLSRSYSRSSFGLFHVVGSRPFVGGGDGGGGGDRQFLHGHEGSISYW